MTIQVTLELLERLKTKNMVWDIEKGKPIPRDVRVIVCSECGQPPVWFSRKMESLDNVPVIYRHASPIRKRQGKPSAHDACQDIGSVKTTEVDQ